jgi:tRNA pseudouridine13 synthase
MVDEDVSFLLNRLNHHLQHEMEPVSKRQKLDMETENISSSDQNRSWGANASVAKTVGVDEFVSGMSTGFSCSIKGRFSDFQVNEIESDGTIVELQDLQSLPVRKGLSDPMDQTSMDKLTELFGEETIAQLKSVLEGKEEKVVLAVDETKESRTLTHQLIRTCFSGKLDSKTRDKSIEVVRIGKGGQKRSPQVDWKALGGEYCQCVLYKENRDSHEALGVLSKLSGVNNKAFGIAGTKDKRAVTSQLITVHKTSAEQLRKLNARLRGIQLGNFKYVSQGKQLGDLWGNRFVVVMR